jgi:hypothetical protein
MLSRLGLFGLLVALPLAFGAKHASATAYSFNSSGSFSNCVNCSINSSGTEFGWGGTNNINGTGYNAYNGSTMTANPLSSQTGNTPATADTIGSLTWENASTSADNTAMTVTASYALALHFTLPGPGGTTNDVFNLNVTNTANNAQVCVFFVFCSDTGDVNDTTQLTGGSNSLTVDGLTLTNISFIATGGSTFNAATGIWSNPEGNTSTLLIKADIANATPVPEPGSLAILGTALAGLALVRSRKRRTLKA